MGRDAAQRHHARGVRGDGRSRHRRWASCSASTPAPAAIRAFTPSTIVVARDRQRARRSRREPGGDQRSAAVSRPRAADATTRTAWTTCRKRGLEKRWSGNDRLLGHAPRSLAACLALSLASSAAAASSATSACEPIATTSQRPSNVGAYVAVTDGETATHRAPAVELSRLRERAARARPSRTQLTLLDRNLVAAHHVVLAGRHERRQHARGAHAGGQGRAELRAEGRPARSA